MCGDHQVLILHSILSVLVVVVWVLLTHMLVILVHLVVDLVEALVLLLQGLYGHQLLLSIQDLLQVKVLMAVVVHMLIHMLVAAVVVQRQLGHLQSDLEIREELVVLENHQL